MQTYTIRYHVEGDPIREVERLTQVQIANLLGTLAIQHPGKIVTLISARERPALDPNDLLLEASFHRRNGMSYGEAHAALVEQDAGFTPVPDKLDLYCGHPDY